MSGSVEERKQQNVCDVMTLSGTTATPCGISVKVQARQIKTRVQCLVSHLRTDVEEAAQLKRMAEK